MRASEALDTPTEDAKQDRRMWLACQMACEEFDCECTGSAIREASRDGDGIEYLQLADKIIDEFERPTPAMIHAGAKIIGGKRSNMMAEAVWKMMFREFVRGPKGGN